jgi:SAM-dependent methyltransferase
MMQSRTAAEFDALLEKIGAGVPDADQYQRMSGLVLDFPEARKLAGMDPFSPDYKEAAMALYLSLRGRADQGYVARRDESPAGGTPENPWTGMIPWAFRDAGMVSEHVLAWGHILRHANLPRGGSVLEYGPGTGQILLMFARMGYRACGVDIDAGALEGIRAQADHLRLQVEIERNEFGLGFGDQKFDTILFYESFHHAFEFEALLIHLLDRLNPGGRILLCGEPVVSGVCDAVPYPWGPRLDALSVFSTRRFGWMELGFTHDYLMQIAQRTGWAATFYPFADCGRAAVYVLEPAKFATGHVAAISTETLLRDRIQTQQVELEAMRNSIEALQRDLAMMRRSVFWRMTSPLRASKSFLARTLGTRRPPQSR